VSRYLEDTEELLDDFASALTALRQWLMQIAEQHDEMDTSALDDLLRRYKAMRL
jgi:hypothetical protein